MRKTKLLKPFVMLLMLTMAMLVPQTAWAEDVVQVASGEDLIAAIVDNNATNVPVTIQFTQDIEVSSDIEINGMQNITFDLNGHKFVIPRFGAYGKAVLKNGIVYSTYQGFSLSGGEIDLLNIDVFAMNRFYLGRNSKLNIHNNVNITCPEDVVYVSGGSLNIDGICSFITTGQVNAIYKGQGSVNVGFNYRLTAVDGEEIVLNQSWGKSLLCVYNGTCTTAGSHNAVHHAAVESATCLETAHAEYYSCSKCGRFFSDETCTETVSELIFTQGSHSYGELIEATEATCTSQGNIAHYECANCHRLFDADKNLVYSILSDPLGHDFDADGICQRCGAEKVVALKSGDNDVVIENPTPGSAWDNDYKNPENYTLFKLVAAEDNDITIKGVGNKDTYGVLYDADMNYIGSSDDENGGNFKFSIQDAKAGDVYYIGARGYANNEIGKYIINVIYGPEEDDPVGPVELGGRLTVGGTIVDLADGDAINNFNSENEGKMSINITDILGQTHCVLNLNNAEITAGAVDNGGAMGIVYFGSVPLIINLTGKNSINFTDVTETAMGVYTESELMFTGTGSLDINCADGTAPMFVGIAADNLITYSQEFADEISSSPMDLSFKGSININGKTQMAALGLLANDYLILTSGEFNINTESAYQQMTTGMIVRDGNIALMDTKVKINSSMAGIAFAAPELAAKKLMPKKSSRKAKAGKKKINIIGTPGCDLFVAGADVEIDAAGAAIVNARQNPSCVIVPASTPGGVLHIAAGTSKETAEDQVIDGEIDIFAEAAGKNYLHIYETGEAIMNVHLYDTEAARDEYLETKFGGCQSYSDLFTSDGSAYLDITLHRTFQNDGWYTLCLPFDLEVAGSPFSKAAHFAGIERIINDDDLGVQFSLGFNTVDKMIAGIPYLVKVDHTVQNPEFKNIKFNYVKPGYEAYDLGIATFTFAFNGSFDPVETFGGYFAGVGAGNMVNAINNGTKIRGFRGFFTLPAPYVDLVNGGNGGGGPIEIEAKKMTFTVDGANEGAATDIDPDIIVNSNAGDGKTYNVMGQRVNKNAKGLIIRNGKTIFKK